MFTSTQEIVFFLYSSSEKQSIFILITSAFHSVEGVSQSSSALVKMVSTSKGHAGTCMTWSSENLLDSLKTRTLGEEKKTPFFRPRLHFSAVHA